MGSRRRILVPVHASSSSRAALARARVIAEATGASLRVLSVEPLRAMVAAGLAHDGCDVNPAPGLRARLEAAGLGVADPGAETLCIVGDPCAVILAEAARRDVDLVVIGHGERGWLARGMTSPLHERVVRHARAPVLVVHAEHEGARGHLALHPSLTTLDGPPPTREGDEESPGYPNQADEGARSKAAMGVARDQAVRSHLRVIRGGKDAGDD